MTQVTKQTIFEINTRFQLQGLRLITNWKNWTLYSGRKKSCNLSEIQNYLRFLVLLQSGDDRTTGSSRSVLEVVVLSQVKIVLWRKTDTQILKKQNQNYTSPFASLADLWNSDIFLLFLENWSFPLFETSREKYQVLWFRYVGKKIISDRVEPTYQKTMNFFEKTLFFWY